MNKTLTIYLAGPMDRVSGEEMNQWRSRCHDYFVLQENVKLLDPTRREHEYEMTCKEIFIDDLEDVKNSDIILVDTRPNKLQFGTPCEVFYASHILGKKVFGWFDEDDNPNRYTRIFQEVLLTNEFSGLEKALEHIDENYVKYL
jgi:nucleoside 2-deoxyribosyltransferase